MRRSAAWATPGRSGLGCSAGHRALPTAARLPGPGLGACAQEHQPARARPAPARSPRRRGDPPRLLPPGQHGDPAVLRSPGASDGGTADGCRPPRARCSAADVRRRPLFVVPQYLVALRFYMTQIYMTEPASGWEMTEPQGGRPLRRFREVAAASRTRRTPNNGSAQRHPVARTGEHSPRRPARAARCIPPWRRPRPGRPGRRR